MDFRRWIVPGLAALVLVVAGVIGVNYVSSDSDGFEEGKIYELGYVFQATIEGSNAPAVVLNFRNRNLPRETVLVPLHDSRGIELLKEDASMKPGTVRKVRIRVPEKVIEGVKYPAYEYLQWQYNLGVKEPQKYVPKMVPRR